MTVVIGLILLGLLMTSLILPWLHRGRIRELGEEIERLRNQMFSEGAIEKQTPLSPEQKTAGSQPLPPINLMEQFEEAPKPARSLNFEKQCGENLPVWIGGIALALAGFFMVKYSIETGLLSPVVRVVLGIIFGIGLLAAGHWVREKKADFANGMRIAQALSGAGIADLYICLFSASSLYHLVPDLVGFAGMGIVTAIAVILSLRHGPPIALLGLVGGFLTPALVGSSEPNTPLLFIYLYFVLTGLFAVIRQKNWWVLSIPTVVGAFIWVIFWMCSSYNPADSIWLGLFLLAVSSTVVLQSKKAIENGFVDTTDALDISAVLNYLTLGGAILLMGAIAAKSSFGFMEWGMFGLLAACGLILAYFSPKIYGFVPFVSMAVNAVMLFGWQNAEPQTFIAITSAFALLYCVGGYYSLIHMRNAVFSGRLAAATSIGYYLISYYKLHFDLSPYHPFNLEGWPVWGIIAMLLSLLAVQVTKEIMEKFEGGYADKQRLLAIFSVTATAFLSIGLTIELQREFLSVAFAAQVLAISLINTKVNIKALRTIVQLLACIFGFLLVPQILLLVQLTAYSLMEAQLHLQENIPIVNWPLFQLGLPALMFAGSSLLLRKQADDQLVSSLEVAAIALVGVMGYYLTRHAFHIDENVLFVKAGFIERGVITNILFLYGLACLWIGRVFTRNTISISGIALCGIALFRIFYFDLFTHNPLWSHQSVGSMPLVNGLLLAYGLPALWLTQANREMRLLGNEEYRSYTGAFLLGLIFTFLSFNIRQLFHGEYLDTGITENAEIYTYSAAWLVLGVVLLLAGTLQKDKMIRSASLVVMLMTVGKVFLYDASELTGLYRVFSFLGLGLSLIALSWFYTRFVFGKTSQENI